MTSGSRFQTWALITGLVGCNGGSSDDTMSSGESTGSASDCIEINEGSGGEDCDSAVCSPGDYCVGPGICGTGCRKTVTCATGEYCDLSTADPISPGTCRVPTASQDVCGEQPTTSSPADCQSSCYLKLTECAFGGEGFDPVASCQDICGRTTPAEQECILAASCASLEDGQECGVVLVPPGTGG